MTVVAAIAVAAIFGGVGLAKVLALPPMREAAAHLGFTVGTYRWIGVLELAGAAGVLLGLSVPWIGFAAATGLLLLLAGGVICHLRVGDGYRRALIPVLTAILVAGYAVALGRR